MKNIKLIEVSNYLDRIKKYAYKDIAHIENHVLNKNPYTSKFILNSLAGKQPIKPSKFFLCKQIFIYYAKNFAIFFLYLVCYILFNLFVENIFCSINVDFGNTNWPKWSSFFVQTIRMSTGSVLS